MTSGCHQATGSSSFMTSQLGSTASGLTTGGESALPGPPQALSTLRSRTTTERGNSESWVPHMHRSIQARFCWRSSSYRSGSASTGWRRIGVPPRRINEIVHGKRSISPDTALRLSRGTRRVGPDSLRLGRPARGPIATTSTRLRPWLPESTVMQRGPVDVGF